MDPISNSILIFTIISLLILAAPLLSPKIKIPDIVLLMAAGAALGPHGLHLLQRNSAITLFGEVGLVYIMFLSGLEIDLYEFMRTRKRSIGFGLITFLIPQVLGTLGVYYALDLSWPASILVASMFASHTLLSYPIASRLGIHRSEAVTVAVGATIITNVLALLVLAVVVDSAGGTPMDFLFWLRIAAGMAILVIASWWGIPKLARWFFQNVTESGGSQFMFVLAVTCACAYLSNYARMEPIIGAFLAGAAFNRLIPERSPLMSRLVFAGNTLFIPFFLISVGMLVDPSALTGSLDVWKVIGVMVGLVIATKGLAAWIGGKLFSYSRNETGVVFGLSVVQAAATLAAVLVGLRVELLTSDILNGAIGMILVTVLVGAGFVERCGRKMALKQLTQPETESKEQRILISVANPFSAARLMELGLFLRSPTHAGALYPTTIVRQQNQTSDAVSKGEELLAKCLAQTETTEERILPNVRVDLNPADGIARAAEDVRADVVLTGWGGEHTANARIFGSVNRKLSETCPSRLFLCRILTPLNNDKRILLPCPPLAEYRSDVDLLFSDAKRLCKQLGAELTVYLHGAAADKLEEAVTKALPKCPLTVRRDDTWSASRVKLFQDIRKDSLVLLPQERKNSTLWTPTLDRIPELIAAKYPEVNFLVVFPALPRLGESTVLSVPPQEQNDFPETHALRLTDNLDAEAAILHLLRSGMPNEEELISNCYQQLLTSARHHPVEVCKGILLLHAHAGNHKKPILLTGVGQIQHPFFERESPPRVLLALITPLGYEASQHLHTLATVAECFRNREAASRLQHADTSEDILHILAGLQS
ncbi:MAG: cation:proton antiporter [Verrucomicrobia bacterium]|nr:cation:proton antiporter [Verrucomicrobiota bacterium]MCH8527456.1 cation:proton antiporter [Kiritimatiellia bacterium]